MAYQGGLRKWFKEDWRDVATGKKCGRKKRVKYTYRFFFLSELSHYLHSP